MSPVFELFGVVHLVRPTLQRAATLDELREGIVQADPASLFHHGVQFQLRIPPGEDTPHNDFSSWVSGVVQDAETAERLSFAVQSAPNECEPLREAIVSALDRVPAGARRSRAAPEDGEFRFLMTSSVVVPSGKTAADPSELLEHLYLADTSVWFYHFVERPWFVPGAPTPIEWLRERREDRLAGWLEDGIRSGRPIELVRRQVLARWRRSRIAPRLAASVEQSDLERREAARQAVSGLVRRIKKAEGGGS
jgi:hypothetical protein